MRVEQWMTANPLAVEPHTSVTHARELLKAHRINQLPVTLEGRLAGIVTDRDLRDARGTIRTLAAMPGGAQPRRRSPQELTVDAVMTTSLVTIEPHDAMERAAVLMRRERIGALPVVHRGELRGIVTRTDVMRAFLALASFERKRGAHRTQDAEPPPLAAIGNTAGAAAARETRAARAAAADFYSI